MLFVIWSHWSQLVTLVTVKVRDLNNDGLDVYYGPYGPSMGIVQKSESESKSKSEKINLELVDLLASPQVKMVPS